MNWHEELLNRGFIFLESTTRLYGYDNGKFRFTGSILMERNGKLLDADFEPIYVEGKIAYKYYPDGAKEVFCPFIRSEDDKRPNDKHNSIVLRNIEELDEYIKMMLV